MRSLTAIAYDIARGSVATCYSGQTSWLRSIIATSWACGEERSSVSAKEHIVFFGVGSVPHQLRDERSEKLNREWPSGSSYILIALAGGRRGINSIGPPPNMQCDPISPIAIPSR
jgi:hypothetical protein